MSKNSFNRLKRDFDNFFSPDMPSMGHVKYMDVQILRLFVADLVFMSRESTRNFALLQRRYDPESQRQDYYGGVLSTSKHRNGAQIFDNLYHNLPWTFFIRSVNPAILQFSDDFDLSIDLIIKDYNSFPEYLKEEFNEEAYSKGRIFIQTKVATAIKQTKAVMYNLKANKR